MLRLSAQTTSSTAYGLSEIPKATHKPLQPSAAVPPKTRLYIDTGREWAVQAEAKYPDNQAVEYPDIVDYVSIRNKADGLCLENPGSLERRSQSTDSSAQSAPSLQICTSGLCMRVWVL